MAKHPIQMTEEMREIGALAAALWYARRDRRSHPGGWFDNAKRFFPSDDENADDYTFFVRRPSQRFPNSYNQAARSRRHCLDLTFANRRYVEEIVARERLLDGVDVHKRKLGAGWVLKDARADHALEQGRIAEALAARQAEEAAKAAEEIRQAKEAAEMAAEEARPTRDEEAALLAFAA